MKTLIFSDIHVAPYEKFGRKDSVSLSKRLEEIRNVLLQIVDVVKKEKIERVIFGGDFFHSDKGITSDCLNVTEEFFNELYKLNIKLKICRGNHDLAVKHTFTQWNYSLAPFINQFGAVYDNTDGVYLLHYDIPCDYDVIKNYSIVVAHKMPIGCRTSSGFTFEDGVDWKTLANNNKLVVFGHSHNPMPLSTNCFVAGSTVPLTFGDVHSARVYIIEDGKPRQVNLNSPKFITVNNDSEVKEDNNYYRVLGNSEIKSDRVISVKEPTFFEQRIKANTLVDILKEWMKINNKDESYFDLIKADINQDLFTLNKIKDLKLTHISIENFMSFDKAEVDVINGLTLIEGKNEGFSSNGSGKSTIAESIYFCLFNETTKGVTGDDVIRKYPKQQKDCKVRLLLTDDAADYKITRSRKDGLVISKKDHGVDAWCILNNGLKQKESQELLEKLFGFNSTIYRCSSYFSQDQLLLLTKIGTAEKNTIITDLLGFEQYDILSNKILTRINLIETEKSIISRNIDKITGQLTVLKDNEIRYTNIEKTYIERAEAKKLELLDANTKLKNSQNELNEYKQISADTSDIDTKIKVLQKNDNSSILKSLNDNLNELTKSYDQEKYDDRYSKINNIVVLKTSDLNRKKDELTKLNNKKTGEECKYCGSIITEEHKQKYIDILNRDINMLIQESAPLMVEYTELGRIRHEKMEEIKTLRNSITREQNKYQENSKAIVSLQKSKQQIIEGSNKKSIIQQQITSHNAIIERITLDVKQLKVDFITNKEVIHNTKTSIVTIELELLTSANKIKSLDADIEKLTFWRESLSYKGVKSMLLDGFCNSYNDILKGYIAEISNGVISAEFSPTSVTKGGESRNKLDLKIIIAGIERIYDSLSGGEKRRVDISVCLAFSTWISKQNNLKTCLLNTLIFDEIFEHLDTAGEECIAPLLQKEGLNKAVFVISHTSELSSYVDKIITVVKKDMVSYVK